jgi:hypothetical protein
MGWLGKVEAGVVQWFREFIAVRRFLTVNDLLKSGYFSREDEYLFLRILQGRLGLAPFVEGIHGVNDASAQESQKANNNGNEFRGTYLH